MKNIAKVVIGFAAAIFIGAIGSGVWEYVLEPSLKSSSNFILRLATLGIDSFKDDLYKEISNGFHEKPSLSLLSSFSAIYIGITLVIAFFAAFKAHEIREREQKILCDIENMKEPTEKKIQDLPLDDRLVALEKMVMSSSSKKLVFYSYIFGLMVIIMSIVKAVTLTKDVYVNDAVTHYEKLFNATRPYLETNEAILIKSEFAQIRKRSDYVNIIKKLEKTAINNDLLISNFEIW